MALDKLIRYEWAALGQENLEKHPDKAIQALEKHYRTTHADFEEDEALQYLFAEAKSGLSSGHFTSPGLLRGMNGFANIFVKNFNEATVGELISYSGYKMPDYANSAINPYKNKKYEDLVKDAKNNKEAKKIAIAIGTLKDYRFRTKLEPELAKMETDEAIESLFKPEEKKAA